MVHTIHPKKKDTHQPPQYRVSDFTGFKIVIPQLEQYNLNLYLMKQIKSTKILVVAMECCNIKWAQSRVSSIYSLYLLILTLYMHKHQKQIIKYTCSKSLG